ncbi:S-adenosyl-L-methionine-dependent methyltransferase [Chytriomyces sp. MP71]|nr:S-adenosyl-L-methionine-dependent methyltransferase [Chytriomyces sp. MP71]
MEVYPARIRFHEPETNQFTPTSDSTPLPHKLAMTIVDVAQDDDEEDEEEDMTPEGGKETRIAFTRHLVLGPWHGIPSFRETEVDLDHPPPGSHLESWYTCAMVCAGYLATRKAGRGKCLIVGLGGGAMASFMGRYWPGVSVEAVEIDPRVVKVAERWFGVKCEPSLLTPSDGELGDGADEPQHFKVDPSARPARVRVTNAEAFVAAAVRDVECRYDVILLDVYTRGEFPPALVNPEFFGSLKKLLKTKENEGWDGAIVVNAGVGLDRVRVEELIRSTMPATRILIDANASSRMDDDNENSVVMGLSATGTIEFSPKEWKRRALEVKESWPDAPLPPFELKNAIHGAKDEIMLAWAGNSMLDEVEASGDSAPKVTADDVQLLSKDDPAFSLFD